MTTYRKFRSNLIWHFNAQCSAWPGNGDFDQQERFPVANADQFCKECLNLSRTIALVDIASMQSRDAGTEA